MAIFGSVKENMKLLLAANEDQKSDLKQIRNENIFLWKIYAGKKKANYTLENGFLNEFVPYIAAAKIFWGHWDHDALMR